MSYIDSYRHELVGLFGSIPVYHPLENIDGDEQELNFSCTTNQIVIGGGSGEHPGLIIRKPNAAVASFLDESLRLATKDDVAGIKQEPLTQLADDWSAIAEDYLEPPDGILHFAGWTTQQHHEFFNMCQSPALLNPYTGDGDFENWLVTGIGEFIFFAMPDLAGTLLSRLGNPYQHFNHSRYNNIMIFPPNMPVYANGGNAWKFKRRHIGESGAN